MSRILNWFIYRPAKHLYQLITDRKYRNYCVAKARLLRIPRYTKCNVQINGWDLHLPDSASFLSAYGEIFINRIYEFKSKSQKPYILDAGANVGVSVLFFKTLFPGAEITAFEADPKIYAYLLKNVQGNGFSDVVLLNKAVWYEKTLLKFKADEADAGRITAAGDKNVIEVEAIDLKEYLVKRKIDFLKMDIEGAETDVLLHCGKSLGQVDNIFIEYHSPVGEPQKLDQLLGVLKQNGLRYHIHSGFNIKIPYMHKDSSFSSYDMMLNIFAWRDNL